MEWKNSTIFGDRLERHFPRLTKSEQKIASFLLSNYDQAAFLNGADLARELEVSEATIVRFARTIGYESFPQLRRSLQHLFRIKTTPATRLQRKLADLKTGEGHILTKVVEMELQYLSEVPRSISPADFDRAVKIILKGKRVFVFGIGPSRIVAELVFLRLTRFGFTTFCLNESGRDVLDKLLLLNKDDALLADRLSSCHRRVGCRPGSGAQGRLQNRPAHRYTHRAFPRSSRCDSRGAARSRFDVPFAHRADGDFERDDPCHCDGMSGK